VAGGKRVVLVVDDDQSIASLLVEAISGESGYQAIGSPDAAIALETLSSVKVDLVLLDLDLPGMKGADFIDEMRKRPGYEQTPVLIVSATAAQHAQDLRSRGVALYITKPFDLGELLGLIGQLAPAPAT